MFYIVDFHGGGGGWNLLSRYLTTKSHFVKSRNNSSALPSKAMIPNNIAKGSGQPGSQDTSLSSYVPVVEDCVDGFVMVSAPQKMGLHDNFQNDKRSMLFEGDVMMDSRSKSSMSAAIGEYYSTNEIEDFSNHKMLGIESSPAVVEVSYSSATGMLCNVI